jgi:CheY-like chemotaxis protein
MNATELHKVDEVDAPPQDGPRAAPRVASVLLAEDDRALRRYLQVILERAGYRVSAAADGLEAMKAALSQHFDVVITDAVMPHLGGPELCRFLRRHPKLNTVPVIMLSGVEQSAPAPAPATGESADVYLSKPVRAEALIECVKRVLAVKT